MPASLCGPESDFELAATGSASIARPILVTGAHRSGSTWIGRMISLAPGTAYIHEPFHLSRKLDLFRGDVRYWFRYVDDASSPEFERAMADTLQFRYPLATKLLRSRGPRDVREVFTHYVEYRDYRRRKCRPVVKDPLAIMSAEWLATTFDMQVVVAIRHPAAFTYSVMKTDWNHDFSEFLAQPQLMRDLLSPFQEEIRSYAEKSHSVFDQAILLWRIIHHVIRGYRDRHPDWYFVRHMDLSFEPETGFEKIFNWLGLEFTAEVRAEVIAYSGESNPVETEGLYELRRNSRKNVFNWRNRLSESQIAEIRERTSDVWPAFYSERDWIPHNGTRERS